MNVQVFSTETGGVDLKPNDFRKAAEIVGNKDFRMGGCSHAWAWSEAGLDHKDFTWNMSNPMPLPAAWAAAIKVPYNVETGTTSHYQVDQERMPENETYIMYPAPAQIVKRLWYEGFPREKIVEWLLAVAHWLERSDLAEEFFGGLGSGYFVPAEAGVKVTVL
jgi:hypothetical protein